MSSVLPLNSVISLETNCPFHNHHVPWGKASSKKNFIIIKSIEVHKIDFKQLQNNKSVVYQNAQVLKQLVPLSFVSGRPFVCLNTDHLFLTYPFARTGPLSPSAVTAAGMAALDSTTPTQAAHQAIRSAVHLLQKPVGSDCHTGLGSSYESLTASVWRLHRCEGTRSTWTCPGSTILHQLNSPGASGKSSKHSLPSSLAVSLITLSCPWLFFLFFSLSSQMFLSHKIQLPPYLSLIPSFQQGTHQMTVPKPQILF